MDIEKELEKSPTVLLLMPSMQYNNEVVKIAKLLSQKKVCYITLNKTSDSLKETFKAKKVNTQNIVFIDAISRTFKKTPEKTSDTYFVSSPASLTEISLAVSALLKIGFEYVIFDSLTNLLIYQEKAPVAQFVSRLVNKIKETNTKAVFYALSVKEQEELIKESGMFVDKVIDLG